MKSLHLPVRASVTITLPQTLLERLPSKVALFTTAQLLDQYEKVAEQLTRAGKEVIRIKTIHTREAGQLLGCNLQAFSDYTDQTFEATLYVGDGLFHPKALQWKNNTPSFLYNPFTDQEYEASVQDVKRIIQRHQGALSAFRMARTVGVLIPHKPGGQTYLHWALELKDLYPEKTFINLVDYNIDFPGLENYPFCEVFVNTACPRIAFDDANKISKPVVNLEDVSKNFYDKQLQSAKVAEKRHSES